MFALFSAAFSTVFIALGVAAVIGHVVLIDILLHQKAAQLTPVPGLTQQARAAKLAQVPNLTSQTR